MSRAHDGHGELLRSIAYTCWIVAGMFVWAGVGYWCADKLAAANGWALGLVFVLVYLVFTLIVLNEVLEEIG